MNALSVAANESTTRLVSFAIAMSPPYRHRIGKHWKHRSAHRQKIQLNQTIKETRGYCGQLQIQPCQGWGRGFESLRPLQFFKSSKPRNSAVFAFSGRLKSRPRD